ncbi:MAG TPA: hypothetical protein VKD72_04145 [Gemmataceae bacterium]|nr:hypothetical protein [Gemmataceae bacterium]
MLLCTTVPAKGKKLTVELYDGEKLVFADKIDPMNARAVTKLVHEILGRGCSVTSEQILELRHGGERELTPVVDAPTAINDSNKLRIVRRKLPQPASAGRVFGNISDALSGGAADDLLEWDDIHQLAVLDIDYHSLPLDQRPQPFQLEALALIIQPRPIMFWISKGRGLHLIYEPVGGLTAEEAAACAGLHAKQLDPKCTFEVIARTSYPPGGEVWM